VPSKQGTAVARRARRRSPAELAGRAGDQDNAAGVDQAMAGEALREKGAVRQADKAERPLTRLSFRHEVIDEGRREGGVVDPVLPTRTVVVPDLVQKHREGRS